MHPPLPPPPPLRFVRQGQTVTLDDVPAGRRLLDLLREDLGLSGTKEGCGTGDCGACMVVLGHADAGQLQLRAVPSCLCLAHAIDGQALWTIEDLAHDGALHPVQQALVEHHGSQCGFCTPGIAMSLFALYEHRVRDGQPIGREDAIEALSGNLCRCTGYRPIVEAACAMTDQPPKPIDTQKTLSKLERIPLLSIGLEGDLAYITPQTLPELLQARARHPEATLVAGGTDLLPQATQQRQPLARVLDLGRVDALHAIRHDGEALMLGAAASVQAVFAALAAHWPGLRALAQRFASAPLRAAATLGGNLANASPVADLPPLLIALGAQVELASVRGKRRVTVEAFYTGYRQTVLAPDELVVAVWVPLALPDATHTQVWAHKVSKRWEDDIAAVTLALRVQVLDGVVQSVGLGLGGVAATPLRARQAEAALQGQPWNAATIAKAAAALQAECEPLSDLRASRDYRLALLGNLLQRCWLDSQGLQPLTVADLAVPTHRPAASKEAP